MERKNLVEVWSPQPGPQEACVECPIEEELFGGARGGGKSDCMIGKNGIKAGQYGEGFNGLYCRRELPMLDDVIERSKQIYGPIGAIWNEQKKTWRFPGGGRLRFRPLETVDDAAKYVGQNVTDLTVEEVGDYPDPAPIDRLFGVLRSAHGVPCQLHLTGNPGGPGAGWIKERFIDPCPTGMEVIEVPLPNGQVHHRIFIPSKVADNQILLDQDPNYINKLYLVGSPELVKAWLCGDWNAIEGAFFSFGFQHIKDPVTLPKHWTRFMSFDWGSYRPFCALWMAVSDGTLPEYPKGAIIVYREYYGASKANVGLKMRAEAVADEILKRETPEEQADLSYRICDPACFQEDGGPSIAEVMRLQGCSFRPGDNSRLAGWQQVRSRLIGEERPMLYVFSNCVNLIRTLPAMQHDSKKPEDLDTDAEDHAVDALRYGLMSRPWLRLAGPPELERDGKKQYLRDLMNPFVTRDISQARL